jgi:hypothetical protein
MIEKYIASFFSLGAEWNWVGEGLVFGQPHHEVFVVPPVAVRSEPKKYQYECCLRRLDRIALTVQQRPSPA